MNVIIVTQTFPPRIGGMQNVMFSIAKGLSKRGFNVTVLPDLPFFKEESFTILNTWSPKIFRPFFKRNKIRRLFNEIDIVICDSWKSVNAVPKPFKNIYCFAMGQEFLVKSKKMKNIQSSIDRLKKIIPITNYTKQLLKKSWIVQNSKINVINPTFSLPTRVQRDHSLKKNSEIKLLSLCRIEKRKGLMQIATALSNLKEVLPKFVWHICGDGPFRGYLEEFITNSTIKSHVRFEGSISEEKKAHFLQSSDLFVMPSYKLDRSVEGFGISYIEAAQFGLPSIAGNDGGVSEAVIDNYTGWCVNTKDQNKLEEILYKAMRNKPLLIKYGKNALKEFNQNFTSEKAFENLIKVIDNK